MSTSILIQIKHKVTKQKGKEMSRFTDKLCPVCRVRFTDNSDIVVCPECGTPHHRACYAKTGSCAVGGYHAEGFVWNGMLPDEMESSIPRSEPKDTYGPHRAEYPHGYNSNTGSDRLNIPEMEGMEQMPNQYFEFYRQIRSVTDDEERGADGVSGKELCHFAGKSIVHYSQAFAAFRKGVLKGGTRQPVKVFLNFCAGFFMPIHQFYRRMDALGIALLVLSAVTALPEILLYYDAEYASVEFAASTTAMLNAFAILANLINFAATMLLCVFGDYIYYKFCVGRIKKIRARFDDGRAEGYYMALTESGAPSKLRAVIGILAVLLVAQLVARIPGQLLM